MVQLPASPHRQYSSSSYSFPTRMLKIWWSCLILLCLLPAPNRLFGGVEAATSPPASATHMGEEWTQFQEPGGKTTLFKAFPLKMNFMEAERHCQLEYNAHLASFASATQYEFIRDLVRRMPTNSSSPIKDFWVGLYNKGEVVHGLTNYQLHFLDGTEFVIWRQFKYFVVDDNLHSPTPFRKTLDQLQPDNIFCMDYKAYDLGKPSSSSAEVNPEDRSYQVYVHNVPCQAKLSAHVCKLDADKAIPVRPHKSSVNEIEASAGKVTTEEQRGSERPTPASGSIVFPTPQTTMAVPAPNASTPRKTGSDDSEAPNDTSPGKKDQLEKSTAQVPTFVLPLILACIILFALLLLLCGCQIAKRCSKGKFKRGTYYVPESNNKPSYPPSLPDNLYNDFV